MDAAGFQRLKGIIAAALELPAAERDAFLDERCAGDAELRREAASLLAAAPATPPGFTDDVAARVGREAARAGGGTDELPEAVGPYRITGVLGQGGMGTVYRARQTAPLTREVALKLIRFDPGNPVAAARFAVESQALAAMDHPNVARVHDAGRAQDGRPFLAMELVHGRSLTRYCDEQRLPVEARLRLFRQVCDGVGHAHQRGIIHRDLKPSNVLVTEFDGRPVPKVIDFGIAKLAEERSLLTEAGVLVGTLDYMSPEQAALDPAQVDIRADIYSLGVLLYELVCGRLPFEPAAPGAASLLELRRRLLEDDPPRPSRRLAAEPPESRAEIAAARGVTPRALERHLRGELDWVAMKALEKDPARRYQSAHDLGAEIDHVLNHLPVDAGPPSARYRAAKFVRRHRVGVTAAAAVAVAVLAGAALAVTGLVRATHAQRRAEAEVATTGAINEFLTDMLGSVQPDKARGREVTVREMLEAAATQMSEQTAVAGSPAVEASLCYTIGVTYSRLGDYGLALQFLERALAIRQRRLEVTDERIVDLLDEIGRAHWEQGDLESSLQVALEILAIRERTSGKLTARYSAALGNVGNTYADMGRLDEAERHLREAVSVDRRVLGEEDGAELAVSLNNLGSLLADAKRFDEAIPLHRESLALRRRFHGQPSPAVQTALNNLGFAQLGLGRQAAAESTLGEALRDAAVLYGQEHPQTALARVNLAGVLRAQGRLDQAAALLREAIPVFERALGPEAWRTGTARAGLGSVLTEQGRHADAEKELLDAWRILDAALGPDAGQARTAAQSLARLYEKWGKASLAADWRARAAGDAQ